MKKLTLLAVMTAAITPIVHADTILGVYAGFGSWNSSYYGQAGEPSTTLKDLGVKDHQNNYYYIALEHPIPILPNIRLEHTDISSKQTANITKTFTIDGSTFSASDIVTSEFDLTHTDATLYYEILDNWVNLDIGLTGRKFDGFVYAKSSTDNKKVKIDQTLPMLYGKAQFDLPFTGLSAGIEGNYVSYSGDKVSDYSAKISYLFDSVVDIGVEAGYRKLTVKVNDNDLRAKVELKGPYAAIIAHF